MAISAGVAYVDVLPNMSKFGPALAASGRGSTGLRALGGAAVAVGAGLAVSVKMATEFEQSMRNVNSIAKLSEGQFKSLGDDVLALAGPTAQAPKTLADGLYELVSSGFDAEESMVILEASAKAATAGLTTTDVAAKGVSAVLNAYRLPASKAAQVSDELFKTVELGAIKFEELATGIGDTLPFAASLGVGLEEVGAATATMTKQGLSSSETFTRIRNLMQTMIKPGDELSAAFKDLGYENGEALIKAEGFQGALEKIVGTTDGSKDAIAALFPNIRSLGGALALTGKNAASARKDLDGMRDSVGAADAAFKEQSKSLGIQFQELKARLSVLAIEIGSVLIPALTDAVKWINEGGLGDAFKKVQPILDTVADAVKTLASGFASLPGPLQLATAGVLAFSVAVKAGLGPWGLAITACTALAAAFQTTSDAEIAAMIAQGKWNKSLPSVVANVVALRNAMNDAKEGIGATADGLVAAFDNVYGSGKRMGEGLKVALTGIGKMAKGVLGDVVGTFNKLGRAMAKALTDGFKSVGKSTLDVVKDVTGKAANAAARESRQFATSGKLLGDNLRKGLGSTVGALGATGKQIANSAVTGSNSQRGAFAVSGRGHGQNLASGLRSTAGTVAAVGRSIAASAAAATASAAASFFAAGANMGNSLAAGLRSAQAGVAAAAAALANAARAANAGGGGRAMGGPVKSGSTYVVGELGPELFTPSRSGYIVPNNRLAGAQGIGGAAVYGSSHLVIDNWKEGTGHFRQIAGDEIQTGRRFDRTRAAMRR